MSNLTDWLDQYADLDFVWFVKRLSGNDTLANGSHQAGPYMPKDFLFSAIPELNRPQAENPDVHFPLCVDSHDEERYVRAVWYNNKLRGGTRNEVRVTQLKGSSSALLAPENTGALCIFAFKIADFDSSTECHVWICRDETEEDIVEYRMGPVEPGKGTIWPSSHPMLPGLFGGITGQAMNGRMNSNEIPSAWLEEFPSPKDIVAEAAKLRLSTSLDANRRLLRRREREYALFLSIEEVMTLPKIRQGFETMEEFTSLAQKVLQRRKSRSGRSLELHARTIFIEEGLRENQAFAYNQESEPGHKPDFLFPSAEAYRTTDFPNDRLRMLAVKTTCRDRWRQILQEADRIKHKHLLTLQEGISERQFREMKEAKVQLIVPSPLITKFPQDVRPHLQTLENFIVDIRKLNRSSL